MVFLLIIDVIWFYIILIHYTSKLNKAKHHVSTSLELTSKRGILQTLLK